MRFIAYVLFLALLFLPGCTKPIDTGPGLAVIGEQFSEAMRWQDYIGAANFLQQDVRTAFLAQFEQDEDLHVVESRIVSVEFNTDDGTATADYRLQFYRLPSMRVKKWQWSQRWQLSRQKMLETNSWQIVNSPPALP